MDTIIIILIETLNSKALESVVEWGIDNNDDRKHTDDGTAAAEDDDDEDDTETGRGMEEVEGMFVSMFLMPDVKDVVMIPQVQPDQINMVVLFCYLVKSHLSSVSCCTCLHWRVTYQKHTSMYNWSPRRKYVFI